MGAILDRITEIVPPRKGADLAAALEVIRSEFPTVTDFEREFPSLCFALATGVGKTRLMGAFISYKTKVIQVDSSKTGAEEDEMVERLLKVEHTDEPTEIVIHVNMLKEGWDVTTLYTIVPLRAANARILIEQSIGRGLTWGVPQTRPATVLPTSSPARIRPLATRGRPSDRRSRSWKGRFGQACRSFVQAAFDTAFGK
jgi:hypothetical protein